MEFTEGIKNWFFRRGSQVDLDSRVCLLDANGNVIGSNKVMEMLSLPYKSDIGDAFVDLGLPSGRLWASKNLGATSESDYGWYASWGNTEAHELGDGYDFSISSYEVSKANGLYGKLSITNDVAHAYYGGVCRLPTLADLEELINNTNHAWATKSGTNGLSMTSMINGNEIFLPASGYWNRSDASGFGEYGNYWTSESEDEDEHTGLSKAIRIDDNVYIKTINAYAYIGLSIRAVI